MIRSHLLLLPLLLALAGCESFRWGADPERSEVLARSASSAATGNEPGAASAPATALRPRAAVPPSDAALADPRRLAGDRSLDERRQTARVLRFFRIAPEMAVADLYSGSGYWSEAVSLVVGPRGRVLSHNSPASLERAGDDLEGRYAGGRLTNVERLVAGTGELRLPAESFDVVLLLNAYHDAYHVDRAAPWTPLDGPALLARIHDALKPGGVLGVVDAVADPAMAEVPVETLLSEAYAQMQRDAIDPGRAMREVPGPKLPSTPNTVYLCVVDRDRNAASFINSTYWGFGSGRVAPRSGVVLQNRGSGFVIEPGHRNNIAPGKRPMHTIIPAMLTRGDKVIMPFGVMGGDYQPWGHTHVLQNMLLYGMAPQEALDLPRYMFENGVAAMEASIPGHVLHDLACRGHKIAISPEFHGGGQAIWIDWEKGTLAGGTEPRKDGIALGY